MYLIVLLIEGRFGNIVIPNINDVNLDVFFNTFSQMCNKSIFK